MVSPSPVSPAEWGRPFPHAFGRIPSNTRPQPPAPPPLAHLDVISMSSRRPPPLIPMIPSGSRGAAGASLQLAALPGEGILCGLCADARRIYVAGYESTAGRLHVLAARAAPSGERGGDGTDKGLDRPTTAGLCRPLTAAGRGVGSGGSTCGVANSLAASLSTVSLGASMDEIPDEPTRSRPTSRASRRREGDIDFY